MIQEAYCSYEVSKLLKEKGFNESTNRYYNAQYDEIRTVSDTFMTYWNNEEHMKVLMMEGALAIPTLQMVMKWLEIKKNIAIIPVLSSILDNEKFLLDVKIVIAETSEKYSQGWVYENREQACEAAIKYCLENLI